MLLAVKALAVAMPLALVTAVFATAKAPLAPLTAAFTVNVTVTPLTGLPPASLTVACNGDAKAVLIGVLCGVPAVAVIVPAGMQDGNLNEPMRVCQLPLVPFV